MKTKLERRTLLNHDTRQPFTATIHKTPFKIHRVKVELYRRPRYKNKSVWTFICANVPIYTATFEANIHEAKEELQRHMKRLVYFGRIKATIDPITRKKFRSYLREVVYVKSYKKWMHERALKRAKLRNLYVNKLKTV